MSEQRSDWRQSVDEGIALVRKLADRIGWKWTIALGIAGVLIVAAAIGSVAEPEGKRASAAPAASATSQPRPKTFRERIADAGDVKPTGDWSCPARSSLACEVSVLYTPSGIGDDLNRTIDVTRPMVKVLFKERPQAGLVSISIVGDTVSLGGKSGRGELLTVVCSRKANREIDWSRITTAGVKALCNVFPKVKFED